MAGMNDAESSAHAHLTEDVSDNVPTVVLNELLRCATKSTCCPPRRSFSYV